MALETGTYVDDLVTTNPVGGTDPFSQGDDHLRLIKSVLKTTFPNATKPFYLPELPAAKTGAYTVIATDLNSIIPVDVSGGAFTISLTAAATLGAGFIVTLIKSDSSANAVTIDGNGAETINGVTTITLDNQYSVVTLFCTGSAWFAVGHTANYKAGTIDGVIIGGTTPAAGEFTTLIADSIVTDNSLSYRNKILNGSMRVAQRGTSFTGGTDNADDTYTLDRWYVLAEGNDSIDVTQSTDGPDTGGYAIALDVETTGEKFGIAQIIEAKDCIGLIGGNVNLAFDAKVSNARIDTVKAAIVAWSGTADSVTSDIVSTWNADGATPTLIANATFENTPADLSVGTSYARYSVTANVDTASTSNIIVFIWSDDATNPTAGDILSISNVQLEQGNIATPFEHQEYGDELDRCQRYHYRFVSDASVKTSLGIGDADSTTSIKVLVPIPVHLRSLPTVSATSGDVFGAVVGGLTRDNMSLTTVLRTGFASATLQFTTSATSFTSEDPADIYLLAGTGNYLAFDVEL